MTDRRRKKPRKNYNYDEKEAIQVEWSNIIQNGSIIKLKKPTQQQKQYPFMIVSTIDALQ